WMFSSQGGIGEGRWQQDGDRWVVESTHVTADGRQAKTTAVYARGDGDELIVEMTSSWLSPAEEMPADAPAPRRIHLRRAP
ncbi:MAG TPA: hypothetical protein PKC18_09160, partial [Lacipirellulaceae bacterium]|nr:hypothetical protein [Lacipirellulaceae bacterium]